MNDPNSESRLPPEPEDQEAETRQQLAEMGKVIRPRMEAGSYLLGLGMLLITCLLLVPLIQDTTVLIVFGIGMLAVLAGGLYFILVQLPRSQRKE
jgi:hypothetical protein